MMFDAIYGLNVNEISNSEIMKETDIHELLTSHNQELSNEEVLQLELYYDAPNHEDTRMKRKSKYNL